MDYKRRQRRLRESLPSLRLDLLLITHLPNVRYLCGFTGSAGALLLSERRSIFFTDGRYTLQARREVEGAGIVVKQKGPLATAAEWMTSRLSPTRMRVGIESDYLTLADYGRLAKSLSTAFRLQPGSSPVEKMRMIKDRDEINSLRTAVLLGSGLFHGLVKSIHRGVREMEVAAELEHAAYGAGAEGMSFPTIIASGKRSGLPHGRASNQPIRGGFVVCDFGVILAGYCSDMTRTLYVGRPSKEARRTYQAVRDAQQAAIEAVKPGNTVGKVDEAARKLLQKSKLGSYFTHSTGHGVGLEIHEAPRVASGQTQILEPGMVITIEPGVYIPGKFGVRIEDMILVNERSCEVLTPTSKQLIAI